MNFHLFVAHQPEAIAEGQNDLISLDIFFHIFYKPLEFYITT